MYVSAFCLKKKKLDNIDVWNLKKESIDNVNYLIFAEDSYSSFLQIIWWWVAVFRIRIHRIHVFFGLPDPDSLVWGMDPDPALDPDPDPSIIMHK